MALYLSGNSKADELLVTNPFALLVGLVLDQQVPLERAFSAPYDLRERLGGKLDAKSIAKIEATELIAKFSERPALHRFPVAMAERVQALAQIIVEQYGGKADKIWTSAETGEQLLANIRALPGFGEQKARIFVALLGKQLNVRPPGWDKAAGAFATPGSHASVADIDSPEALLQVRAYKREMKVAAKSVEHPAPKKVTARSVKK